MDAKFGNAEIYTLGFYPILAGVMNVLFLCGLICFAMLDGFRDATHFRKMVLIGSIVWIMNAVFTIFASPAALRFQSFQIILVTVLSLLLIDWMLQLLKVKDKDLDKLDQVINPIRSESLVQT